MSTSAPNPNQNLLLLAVLGIGAYYVLTRRALAQNVTVRPGTTANNAGNVLNGVSGLLNSVSKLFSGSGSGSSGYYSAGTYGSAGSTGMYNAAANAANRDEDPSLNGSIADWASSSTDGMPANPPNNTSVYDWAAGG